MEIMVGNGRDRNWMFSLAIICIPASSSFLSSALLAQCLFIVYSSPNLTSCTCSCVQAELPTGDKFCDSVIRPAYGTIQCLPFCHRGSLSRFLQQN
ncbi:hypothetical protein C8J57DRAFT_1303047 [Mycena rebaudengoi]|nr:hypothetical protein C8J57DRAFT_1303047 [Mycena rebaudengoi]